MMLKAGTTNEFEIAFGRKIPKRQSMTGSRPSSAVNLLAPSASPPTHPPHANELLTSSEVSTPSQTDKIRRKAPTTVLTTKRSSVALTSTPSTDHTTPKNTRKNSNLATADLHTPVAVGSVSRKAPTPKFSATSATKKMVDLSIDTSHSNNISTTPSAHSTPMSTKATSPRAGKPGLTINTTTPVPSTRKASLVSSKQAVASSSTPRATPVNHTNPRASVTTTTTTSPRATPNNNTRGSMIQATSPRANTTTSSGTAAVSPRASLTQHTASTRASMVQKTPTTNKSTITTPSHRASIATPRTPSTTTAGTTKSATKASTVPSVAHKTTVSIAAKYDATQTAPETPKPVNKVAVVKAINVSSSLLAPTQSFYAKVADKKPVNNNSASMYSFPTTTKPVSPQQSFAPSTSGSNNRFQTNSSSSFTPHVSSSSNAQPGVKHFSSIAQFFQERSEHDDDKPNTRANSTADMGLDAYADHMVDDVDLDAEDSDGEEEDQHGKEEMNREEEQERRRYDDDEYEPSEEAEEEQARRSEPQSPHEAIVVQDEEYHHADYVEKEDIEHRDVDSTSPLTEDEAMEVAAEEAQEEGPEEAVEDAVEVVAEEEACESVTEEVDAQSHHEEQHHSDGEYHPHSEEEAEPQHAASDSDEDSYYKRSNRAKRGERGQRDSDDDSDVQSEDDRRSPALQHSDDEQDSNDDNDSESSHRSHSVDQAISKSIDEIDSDVDVEEELEKKDSYASSPILLEHDHGVVTLYPVTYISKSDPSMEEKPFTRFSEHVANRINQYVNNEPGHPTTRELACDLIAAAMRMDFDPNFGNHWKHDFTACKNVESDEVLVSHGAIEEFEVSEGYEWDWRDIFSQARATANIVFNHELKTILIKDYCYFCSSVFDENFPHHEEDQH